MNRPSGCGRSMGSLVWFRSSGTREEVGRFRNDDLTPLRLAIANRTFPRSQCLDLTGMNRVAASALGLRLDLGFGFRSPRMGGRGGVFTGDTHL